MKELETSDPIQHSRNIRSGLQELADHLKRDVERVEEAQAKALFETTSEVLNGLIVAYSHYEAKSEKAWQ